MTKKKSKKKTAKKATKKKGAGIGRGKASDLSPSEKATVARMTKAGASMRKIAAKIDRAPSTIWRHQNP